MELTTAMVSSAQLSLFDTATAEVGSLYKPGDWVKLRRKPTIAAWVKRGEVYKVNRVHPIDGSLQFWNPFTNEWDFLYPDEVKLAPAPLVVEDVLPPPVDSVSPASTLADTEYIAEVAEEDYVSKAISTYQPRGTARSGEYFRFSYRDGSRMRHIHIRGGNTDSPIAQAKVQEVRSLLAIGIPPAEIAAMFRNQSNYQST